MTKYEAKFEDGFILTATSAQFKNRLDFYNYICINRLGKIHGYLEEITAKPYIK